MDITIEKTEETEELYTDDSWDNSYPVDKITAIELYGCLLILSYNDDDALIHAWHIAGMDLAGLLNKALRSEYEKSESGRREILNVERRYDSWYDEYGKCKHIIIGPTADQTVKNKFGGTIYKTKEGPVNIEYTLSTREVIVFDGSNTQVDKFKL
jgi:hypothetical protein